MADKSEAPFILLYTHLISGIPLLPVITEFE